jgi:iron(III) transport system substrate-binding protein
MKHPVQKEREKLTGIRTRGVAILVAIVVVLMACSPPGSDGVITLYTSVTQDTVDAVVEAFTRDQPDVGVEVFRAPTGELNARIAAEQREGGIQADVMWLTDPLSMQQYDADGLLGSFTPAEVNEIPAEFRSDRFWGTRLLSMVVVQQAGLTPAVNGWGDLADPAFAVVAIPDPGFAGSALGAMAYLAMADGFGFDFYERLAANGGVQVNSPGDVVTGVAEGQFSAGMTLAFSARAAIAKGSPIEIVWPEPGAIVMYSPIAILASTDDPTTAGAFVDFVLTRAGQEAIAATGWQPVREDVAWNVAGGPIVTPSWPDVFDRQDELLAGYREIFGG